VTLDHSTCISGVLDRMDSILAPLAAAQDPMRYFLGTYRRTTAAVGEALADGRFEDPEWVEEWDVVFADLYLDALQAYQGDPATTPRPWRVAFGAAPDLPPLLHVLLGMNAHINYDLPQALLAVISDEQFGDRRVTDRRHRDHERIDGVLVSRVAAEDVELEAVSGRLRLLDRVMTPVNRRASMRFLTEARRKVWHNTVELHDARLRGEAAYARRLDDLAVVSAARVADLLRPGQVLVRLGVAGFGVVLPPV
jgi:Family of unknown function (DUF5995)